MFFVFYCKGNFCQENFPKWFRHAISYELSHDFHVEESFAESKFSEWKDRQNFMELINLFFNGINYPLS